MRSEDDDIREEEAGCESTEDFQQELIRVIGHVTGPEYYSKALMEEHKELRVRRGQFPVFLPSEPLTSGITLDDYQMTDIVDEEYHMLFHHFFITNCIVMITSKNEYMVRIQQRDQKLWVSMGLNHLKKILDRCACYVDINGKKKKRKYSDYLDEPEIFKRIAKFTGRDFMRSEQDPTCFPAWHGHRYPEVPEVDEEIIGPFLDHTLNVICNGDRELYAVEMAKNAWIFQNPIEHMGWATVLVGPQGTGKSLYCNILCNLWGELYSNPNVKVKHVTDDKAYKIVHYRKLIVCNELPNCASKEGKSTDWEILKSRITDKTLKMRSMYHDFEELQERNVSNYIFCTNNLDSVSMSHDDRRYFVLEVSDAKRGDAEYFDTLFRLSEDDLFLQHLLTYLLHYDTSKLNVHLPPLTETKREMIESNEPYSLQFIKVKRNWRIGKTDDIFVRFRECVWMPYLKWLEDELGVDSSRYAGKDNKFTHQLVIDKWLEKKLRTKPCQVRPGPRLLKFWEEEQKELVKQREEDNPLFSDRDVEEEVPCDPTWFGVKPIPDEPKKEKKEEEEVKKKPEPEPEPKEKPEPAKEEEPPKKRGPGRPKGSKNKPKVEVEQVLALLQSTGRGKKSK
jgi:hypothetical protein